MSISNSFKFLLLMQEKGEFYTGLGDSYIRAFNKSGVNFTIYNLSPDSFNRYQIRLGKFFNSVEDYAVKKLNKGLIDYIEQEEKPNAILVIKGTYLSPDSLRYIKQRYPDIVILCFHPDDPFSPNRGASNDRIRESISLYDVYLIWSKTLIPKLKEHGAKDAIFLPFAADPEIICPVTLSSDDRLNFDCDVCFIGDGDEEREAWVNNIGKVLHDNNCDFNLRVYGALWKKINHNVELKSKALNLDLLKAFSGGKINLNILRLQNKFSHNMRTFEIPASHGFMLHESSEEAMDFFEEGKEAEYFSTPEELLDKLKFYLKNDDLREKIASAAYEKIFKMDYTYDNNVKQILNIATKKL